MWQGILQGLILADEERARKEGKEEARRIREEDMAFRREQFAFQQRQAHQKMLIELYPLMRERSAAASELSNQASILRGYLGDSPIVDTLVGTGNSEALSRVISSLEAGYEAAMSEGEAQGQAYLQAWRTTLENDARITEATQGEIDFSLFDNVVTPEDLTALGLPTTFTAPGTIEVAPVIYQPRATIDDLGALDRRIASTAIELGNTELRRLREATARVSRLLSITNDQDERSNLESTLAAIGDRQMIIEGAIDDTRGDNPSFSGISNIYGTTARDLVISSSPRAVDINSISPAFRENISSQPIVVVSPTHLQVLYESGVINNDSVILYEGQQILVRDIPEAEGQ
jgi:hypothetical protein